MRGKVDLKSLAGIEYHGHDGVTALCLDALARILQFGNKINEALLLSHIGEHSGEHAFLLDVDNGDRVVIKSGFTSGYSGEGPRGLSTALMVLERHNIPINEVIVDQAVMSRISRSALTSEDLDLLETCNRVRPVKYYDYIYEAHYKDKDHRFLANIFPCVLPLAVISNRIMDLALDFDDDPDKAVLTAFRRLEDDVRKVSGIIDESSTRLFTLAFRGEESRLVWKGVEKSEQEGRVQLFIGAYMTYRNPRAHKEPRNDIGAALREFLVINELFQLLGESVARKGRG